MPDRTTIARRKRVRSSGEKDEQEEADPARSHRGQVRARPRPHCEQNAHAEDHGSDRRADPQRRVGSERCARHDAQTGQHARGHEDRGHARRRPRNAEEKDDDGRDRGAMGGAIDGDRHVSMEIVM